MRTPILLGTLTAAALLGGCRVTPADEPRAHPAAPLHDAVAQLTRVIVYDIFSPPQASRVYAYASVAAYEAMRHADTTSRSFAGQVNGLGAAPAPPAGEISYPLAGVRAFMTVGRQLTFSRDRMDSLRQAMDDRFRKDGVPEPVVARSIAYGDSVAAYVLKWASEDGFTRSRGLPKFTVTADAGRWVPTPPAYMDAVEPNWATLRPFALDSASQYRPKPPHPYDTTRTSPFWRDVVEVYDVTRSLTEEQREIAGFWDCNPYVMHVQGHTMFATKKITPGGHWMSIAGIAARERKLGPVASAEAYALTAIALADAFISVWDEKFRSNLVRPETMINAYIDEAWQPVLQTPPFPEYTSGHSAISAAAAEVLTDVLGDGLAYVDSSEVEYGLPARSYRSFNQAAAEAAISRLYAGIHFRRAVEEGAVQGRSVGRQVTRRIALRAGDAPTVVASAPLAARAGGAP